MVISLRIPYFKLYINIFKLQITNHFAIFLSLSYLSSKLSLQTQQNFDFSYDSCCWFVNNFIFFLLKLIISTSCFLKGSPKIHITILYTSSLFFMFLNNYIVDIERPDEIRSLTLVVDDFSELFLHPSIFSIKNWRSA